MIRDIKCLVSYSSLGKSLSNNGTLPLMKYLWPLYENRKPVRLPVRMKKDCYSIDCGKQRWENNLLGYAFNELIYNSTSNEKHLETRKGMSCQLPLAPLSSLVATGTLHGHEPCITSSWYRCSSSIFIYSSWKFVIRSL